jgi:Peptidase M15.
MKVYKVTKDELLAVCFGGNPDVSDTRIDEILESVNIVRDAYGKPMSPSCFYRTVEWDKSKGRSGGSTHCQLMAVDFNDKDGKLDEWCLSNLDVLERAGLWLEDPRYTIGWVHLDRKPRKNRVFIP